MAFLLIQKSGKVILRVLMAALCMKNSNNMTRATFVSIHIILAFAVFFFRKSDSGWNTIILMDFAWIYAVAVCIDSSWKKSHPNISRPYCWWMNLTFPRAWGGIAFVALWRND